MRFTINLPEPIAFNTVNFVQKMLETNLFEKNTKAMLRREIEKIKSLAEKEWLLRMMNPMQDGLGNPSYFLRTIVRIVAIATVSPVSS